jgi:peptide/nickel transport system permease protein
MRRYILKRFLLFIPMFFGITFITFAFIHLAPGNFLDTLKLNPQISPEIIKDYEQKLHLNRPLLEQYFFWVKNILHGDMGYSFAYRAPVLKVIASRALNTLILSLTAVFFTWVIVIPLGVLAAFWRGSFFDKAVSFAAAVGVATPSFFLAFLFLSAAAVFGGLPLGGMHSVNYDMLNFSGKIFDIARHLVIPAFVLTIPAVAVLQKIMRANMLETMGSPYILAARSRGLSAIRIIFVHALRNALNPMITIFGYQFGDLLSGAALVEIVTGWPGLGVVTLDAVRSQDIYLVMGTVVIGSLMLIAGNLLADILLAVFDPRIKHGILE